MIEIEKHYKEKLDLFKKWIKQKNNQYLFIFASVLIALIIFCLIIIANSTTFNPSSTISTKAPESKNISIDNTSIDKKINSETNKSTNISQSPSSIQDEVTAKKETMQSPSPTSTPSQSNQNINPATATPSPTQSSAPTPVQAASEPTSGTLRGYYLDSNNQPLKLDGMKITIATEPEFTNIVFTTTDSPYWSANLEPGFYFIKAEQISGYSLAAMSCPNCTSKTQYSYNNLPNGWFGQQVPANYFYGIMIRYSK